MTINLFQTPEYKTLISEHIFNTITYLFDKNQEFAIACEVTHITFMPQLPISLQDSFDDTVLFILSGYTFESANLEKEYFSFEAGFGDENFGSTVTLPLLAIKQLFVGDHPIVFNLAEHLNSEESIAIDTGTNASGEKKSMESLLNNPKNKKLLKKKK
jgi:hypothetical protein